MIVLISPETDIKNEIQILHQLFDAGLEFYHFRKPSKSLQEHRDYLNQIDEKHHDKIITHYFHELANEFNLKGIHLQEQVRKDLGVNIEDYISEQHQSSNAPKLQSSKTLTISSSFHDPSTLENCSTNFDYNLLSPVFSSISKKGYEGKGFDVSGTKKTIVGMGGVNEDTIEATLKLGYKGIGVLGGVWNAKDPLNAFLNIKKKYDEIKSLNH
ncbi:MAG: thiamine phosphate synthase [Fluviicola sp.]|nr:thiamine phosphate synthase [Fluviicola sp.]